MLLHERPQQVILHPEFSKVQVDLTPSSAAATGEGVDAQAVLAGVSTCCLGIFNGRKNPTQVAWLLHLDKNSVQAVN